MVTSEPPVSENEKREALEAVLNSTTFARSAQLRAFLRHICEMELAGRTAQLNEYEIAVEVLGRRKDIDLTDDSSVRNRAYELRQRLEKYYATEHPHAPVRIEIPRGGYVPAFVRHAAEVPALVTPEVVVGRAHRSRWLPLLAAATVGAVCVAAGWIAGSAGQKPRPPAILEEAWGPLAEPGGDMLISIATNLHLLIRPHVPARASRMAVPKELYPLYGPPGRWRIPTPYTWSPRNFPSRWANFPQRPRWPAREPRSAADTRFCLNPKRPSRRCWAATARCSEPQ